MPKGKKIEPIDIQELEANPVYDGMYDHLKPIPKTSAPIGFTRADSETPAFNLTGLSAIQAIPVANIAGSTLVQEKESQPETSTQTAPTGTELTGLTPERVESDPNNPVLSEQDDQIDLSEVEAALADVPRPGRSRGKVIAATRVEHGHSATQEALYWYLWRLGKPVKGSRSHFVQAGYGQIQTGIGVDRSNVQDAIRELQKKLSLRIVKANTVGSATIYEVFCCDDILAKRREARLVWARTYGKRRVDLLTEAEITANITHP